MHQPITHIVQQFQIYGDLQTFQPWGGGHINDTFLLTFNQAGQSVRYILQKINKNVFQKPDVVTKNISLVCQHILEEGRKAGIDNLSRTCLSFIPTQTQQPALIDEKGDYWRVFLFIENSVAFDFVEKPNQAFEAAQAFARFQLALEGLAVDKIGETIPDFHHLGKRFSAFQQALSQNSIGRKSNIKDEVSFVLEREGLSKIILTALDRGEIPLRIVHNDTKLSNVLLDKMTGEGLCVIDLDTLMPGTLLYDFGDMVRTFTSPVPEDEQDGTKVYMNMEIFRSLCRGYLPAVKSLLVPREKELLFTGARHMTFIMGVRFLTDYLMGDVYYKTKYDTHNLVRAQNQFSLLKSIEQQEMDMRKVIHHYLADD